jgi:hypothetical protein
LPGRLTAESPIIDLFLSNVVQNRVHISSRLRGINILSHLAHRVSASLCPILSMGEHCTSFIFWVPCIAPELSCAKFWVWETDCLRDGSIDPTWIEAEEVKSFTNNFIELCPCSPEQIDSTACNLLVLVVTVGIRLIPPGPPGLSRMVFDPVAGVSEPSKRMSGIENLFLKDLSELLFQWSIGT